MKKDISDETKTRFINIAVKMKFLIEFNLVEAQKDTNIYYQGISEMGDVAISLILQDLQNFPSWHFILSKLTKENPVNLKDKGDNKKIVASWLMWGKQNKLI